MLAGHMDVRSSDRPLQLSPEAFKAVNVGVAIGPLFRAMLHCLVVVSKVGKYLIRWPFVGTDAGSGRNVVEYVRDQGFAAGAWNNLGHQVAATLQHTEDDGFAFGPPASEAVFPTGTLAADIGFVNFDMAGKGRVAVRVCHVLADFMAHTPSALVGNAQLARQFLGRDAVTGRGKEIHGVKPFREGCTRPLKGCSRHGVDVMTAPSALIGGYFADAVELPVFAALRAIEGVAVLHLHKVFQARIVVREAIEKVMYCKCFSHNPIPSTNRLA